MGIKDIIKKVLVLLLLVNALFSFSQTSGLDTNLYYRQYRLYSPEIKGDFKKIDSLVKFMPKKAQKNTETLSAYFNEISTNDYEKVRAFYTYIGEYLSYDDGKSENIKNVKRRLSSEELVKSKKGICGDVAMLFQDFCTRAGIPCLFITGYTKQMWLPPKRKRLDHAWNLLKIDNKWYLVDATWGMKNNTTKKKCLDKINYHYFLPDPHFFVRKHLPADPNHQLMDSTITWSEFRHRKFNLAKPYYEEQTAFEETLNNRLKLNSDLALLQSAQNAYQFNPRYKLIIPHMLWDRADELMDLKRLDKRKYDLEDLQRAREVYLQVQDQAKMLGTRKGRHLSNFMQKKIDDLDKQIEKKSRKKTKNKQLVAE